MRLSKNKKADGAVCEDNVGKTIKIEKACKPAPFLIMTLGAAIMLCQWIIGLNIIAIIGALYMCIVAAVIFVGLLAKKKMYLWLLLGYAFVSFGVFSFYTVNGADAGWGAFVNTSAGFASAEHAFWQGSGNFGTRLLGNALLCSPSVLLIVGLIVFVSKWKGSAKLGKGVTYTMSLLLVTMSVVFVFTMNLRSNPKVFDMSAGHNEYLNSIKKNANQNSPNVLFILMDDLGYGDTSYNALKAGIDPAFQTPNIDSVAQNGCDFDNFYANYSVCSPSRFAAMTDRKSVV